MRPLALLAAALLLVSAAPPPADSAALDALVTQMFAPYHQANNTASASQFRGWSAETAALIAHWRRVSPSDEVDDLSDGDWFCLCQDWDAKAFREAIAAREMLAADRVQYRMQLSLGGQSRREEQLVFRREAQGWRLDDLIASDYPGGLKQALRETIADDEELQK